MTEMLSNVVAGEYVVLDGEQYYRIANSHLMPDFFMSLVGASDHWMFVSSNGALTAGRRNADNALFPYAADDQITAARATTGPTTLLRFSGGEIWEPFAAHSAGADEFTRNLYKTPLGNKLVFEEINHTRGLVFRYRWAFSDGYGFVRSCRLENSAGDAQSFELLDGLINVLPYGIGSEFLMRFSNLGNAYKKAELISGSDLALFYLSSIPTDRAEPSEGLKATTVWQTGLTPDAILLSTQQMAGFREGRSLELEDDVRGKAGAYLVSKSVTLPGGESLEWNLIAELAQDHSQIVELDERLQAQDEPWSGVAADIESGQEAFRDVIASSDGLQCGSNRLRANRHLSNTVFNVMRGGVPLEGYLVHAADFVEHVGQFNTQVRDAHGSLLEGLPTTLTGAELVASMESTKDADLVRLAREYLPLAFSRRHGDPTRPWNRFSIDLKSDSGRTNLNYQGNWRDIFQNWEALAVSFPEFLTAMICRFANATTADGYNPYRVTKDGFEWEEPTPDDPWANIGYWGDHQIIYLLKLMEWNNRFAPEQLESLLNSAAFVHANVPYRIKNFQHIKADSQSTIEFDAGLSSQISKRVEELGTDGKLLRDQNDEIHHVTLLEKLLTLCLAKMSNLIPDGGIWLNTQRPEWNDANNALVGNGLSMVTACYLHRWFKFLHAWVSKNSADAFDLTDEVLAFLRQISAALDEHAGSLVEPMNAATRQTIVESLSTAGSDYREQLYAGNPTGNTSAVPRDECLRFFETSSRYLAATIRNNRRSDGLYHAYNLLDWTDAGVEVEHLYEMLEGQVAVLSAGLLSATESLEVLDALRASALYRENQNSYILYPDRQLPRFLKKNLVPDAAVDGNPLLVELLAAGNTSIVQRDVRGDVHFNGQFKNSADVRTALNKLGSQYSAAVEEHGPQIAQLFEDVFEHRQFTGRSGTFFGYEGLGSIYWHMVSKLGLAVSETYFSAIEAGESSETIASLRTHYEAIRAGIGAEKTPTEYGAFPTDPYSHTPENAGVKQPGMTGQVKEDVLARFAEIGVHIEDGSLCFRMELFDRGEVTTESTEMAYSDVAGTRKTVSVPSGGFGYTLCQVPITYEPGETDSVLVHLADGRSQSFDGLRLDDSTSRELFGRSGKIERIACTLKTLGSL